MRTTYRFELKPEQDGLGYFYGRFDMGDESYRIDILPPSTQPRPFFLEANTAADLALWIVYVNGEEIARVPTREEIEALLVSRLVR